MKVVKAVGFSVLVTACIFVPLVLGIKACDTPEYRAEQIKKYKAELEDDLAVCRIHCKTIGAATYMCNGKGGAAYECLCGGSL